MWEWKDNGGVMGYTKCKRGRGGLTNLDRLNKMDLSHFLSFSLSLLLSLTVCLHILRFGTKSNRLTSSQSRATQHGR